MLAMQATDDAEVLFLVEYAKIVDDILHSLFFTKIGFTFHEVTVHGAGCSFAMADRKHYGHCAVLAVTTGEDTFVIGHHGAALGNDTVPAGLFDTVITVLKVTEVGILADRRNNHVAGDDVFAAGNFHRTAAARIIRFAEFHFDNLNTDHRVVFDNQAGRVAQELELDILFFSVINLVVLSRHLFTRPAIDQDRVFAAFTQSDTHTVNSSVAAADDDNALGCDHAFAESYFAQVVDAAFREAIVAHVFAFDTHRLRFESTCAKEDRVVLFFEFTQGDIATEFDAVFDLDTQVSDDVRFALQQRSRHTEIGNTDSNRTTRLGKHIDNFDLVAIQCQIVGAGQTSGAGTNNDDSLAG